MSGMLISEGGVNDMRKVKRIVLGSDPVVANKLRRVNWDDSGGSDGNGNSSGPCGCCNCLDCIDLCDARDEDVITDCEACGTAIKTYLIDVGNWAAFPNLGGSFLVTHVDRTCTWESDNFTQSSGVYKWVLTLAGGSSTLQLEHVSGADPVHLLNGWRQVKYAADGSWNCLCASHMQAESRERITSPAGLNCSICVIPRLGVYNPTCPTIPSVDGVIPCFPVVTFPDITFLFSEVNPGHCKYLSCTDVPGPAYNFPYGFEGSTVRTLHMDRLLDEHCPWDGGIREVAITATHQGVTFAAVVDYTAGTVDFTFYSYQGQVQAQYKLTPASWVIGLNTLTLFTDYGSSSVVTWPATITITATDCYYSSSHPDYGYGCGYGVSGDEEPEGCGGEGCQYYAYDSEETLGGDVGPWHWGGCEEGCTNPECSMPPPPVDPPTGPTDVFHVLCE